jgi:translation initiation factor 2B subunit (eIF-2B alpha/beta/delta family)
VQQGRRFEALVVDARPAYTGAAAAEVLLQAGVPVSYLPLSAVSHAMRNATKARTVPASILIQFYADKLHIV